MDGEREVAGLRCGAVLEQLSAYLDGELSPEARARIDAHLAGCDVCARFGGAFGAQIAELRAAARESMPDEVTDRLHDALAALR